MGLSSTNKGASQDSTSPTTTRAITKATLIMDLTRHSKIKDNNSACSSNNKLSLLMRLVNLELNARKEQLADFNMTISKLTQCKEKDQEMDNTNFQWHRHLVGLAPLAKMHQELVNFYVTIKPPILS